MVPIVYTSYTPGMSERPIVDFDHHSPDIAADPYPSYAKLRESCPVSWSEHYGGFWVLSDYASVVAASEDDETFCSAPTIALPEQPYGIRNVPIDTDNPETEKFRKILLPAYSPGAAKRIEPDVIALCDELIDEFAAAGRCDLVEEFAMPVPARIILRLIGIDDAEWRWYVDRVHTIVHGMTGDIENTMTAGFEMASRVIDLIGERRAAGDYSGQLGQLLQAEIDGEPLADMDIVSYVLLLFFGGLDTTTGALANAAVVIDRDPALRRMLIENPEKIPAATEEFLRFEAPVQSLGRWISRDIELGGQQLKAGERALLIWASANRDDAAFTEPDLIDVDRKPNRHLAFGVGLHRCLGSNMGRVMFRIMLERLLTRLPDFRVAADPDQFRYHDAGIVYGLMKLPVEFTPSPR